MRLREKVLKQIEEQPLAILATSVNNKPHTTLVAFKADIPNNRILFVTTISSRKAKNIENNPNISLLIDNRTNNITDFRDAVAITVKGEATRINSSFEKYFLDKHPHLIDFLNSPSTSLFKIEIQNIEVVSEFQKVYEMKFNE